ncbi:MAG: polysaccharide deacetylase family protein [Eubacteriales bacterium]|nr:polysaccharide deacetylase family protein [Eubacteriales bacterium]
MSIELFYPNWKKKALTFSYDDAQVYDRKLVEIFNKYNMKATFHLNSGMLDCDGFITSAEIPELYKGHEVACHGVMHEYPGHLALGTLHDEYYEDRKFLEGCLDGIVQGCSYAFGEYNDTVVNMLKMLGFSYCRTVNSTNMFGVPDDFMRWKPTCHHNDAMKLVDQFLNTPEYMRLPMFYIWGHSFEFAREDSWEYMDTLCQKLHGQEDVWYTTNIDYVKYVNAMRGLVFSTDQKKVENPSKTKVYLEIDGERVVI